MAKTAFARVLGTALRVDLREGVAKKTGKAYSMNIATVLVGVGGTTELVLPSGVLVGAGEEVDFLVEVTANEYGFNISVIADPDNSHVANAAAVNTF